MNVKEIQVVLTPDQFHELRRIVSDAAETNGLMAEVRMTMWQIQERLDYLRKTKAS